MAHYGIFREELAIAYPTYGNALWEPDPGGQYDAVEVGDVGFIRRGYFQRLFNVLHPKDHPSHRNPSFVPEYHQQLATIPDHIVKNEIRTGSRQNSIHFCSQHVTLESRGRGTAASGPDDDSEVTFSCKGKQGALLSLPVPAQGEDTVAFGDFGKWMIKHIDAWFAFARGLGLGVERMEDIILVTGRHLTKSWVNVAFTQRRLDAGVSFDVQVSNQGHVSLEQQYVRGGDLKLGPTGRDLPENQCIFVRGFRVVRILGVWSRLRGQAGPAPNAGDHEPEPGSDTQLELISVPADSDDPLHDLLQYIAKEAPDCDMALVHDDDLACIDGVLLKVLRTHKLTENLPKSALTIQQFQCDLFPGNKSGLGSDEAVVKVATLSKHTFEAPREESEVITGKFSTGAELPVAPPGVGIGFKSASSRPDKAAYDAEQKRIKTEMSLLQEKLAAVKEEISNLALQRGSDNERQTTLRAQLKDLRSQHSSNKASRNEILNQIMTLQLGIQKKEKDLRVSRENANFGTVEDVDTHIRNLEEQVGSGSMRVAEEKRALQEINHAKRIRKTVESFQADSDAIDAERAAVETLRKRLDDPEAKASSDRYDAIKAEWDEIKAEADEFYADRSKLVQERDSLHRQLDMLFSERRESNLRFHEANERYYAKLKEDRAQRAEQRRVQREAEEGEKRKARALQLREDASQPAFQVEIEDCQTLIDYFSGKSTTAIVPSTAPGHTSSMLAARQVAAVPDNFVPLKKKGEEEEDYFIGTKDRRKLKKGTKTHGTFGPGAISGSSSINVPLSTLSALQLLSILPPSSQADVPRVIEDLETKKAWFEANQARATAEAIAKAEAEIQRFTEGKRGGASSLKVDDKPGKGSAEIAGLVHTFKATDEPLSDVEVGKPKPEELQETEES